MDKQLPPYNGVEKWAEWLDAQPKHTRLNNMQMNLFISMTMREKEIETDTDALKLIAPKRPNYASMFYNRVKLCHTYNISIAVALFMSELIHRPGEATIYANYLQYKAFKMGKKEITMREIANIWPFGFFSEATLEESWDKQKHPGCFASNMLDEGHAQESIMIKD